MELRHLRYFVAVAEELNFTRAARRCHVAQPALSPQVRQLEDELGTLLLHRNKRGVMLTEAGSRFHIQARELLAQSARIVESAREPLPQKPLRLGYVWGLFQKILPGIVRDFREKEPDTPVHLLDLSATNQAQALVRGELEAGFIGFDHEADSLDLAKQKISSCEFIVALPVKHPFARRAKIQISHLAAETFVMISDKTYPGAALKISETCAQAGFRPRILQAAERGHAVISLVAANVGVALLPSPLRELPHAGVIFRPLAAGPRLDLYLAWNEKHLSSSRDRLIQIISTSASSSSVDGK